MSQPLLASENEQDKLQKLQGEISNLQANISNKQKKRAELIKNLEQTERRIGTLGRSIHNLQNEIQALNKKLNKLQNNRSIQEKSLSQETDRLGQQIRSAYAMGRQERLKMLLNQQDPALMNRIMSYYNYLNEARIQRIHLINQLIDEIRQTTEQINLSKQQLDVSLEEKNRQLKNFEQARVARAGVIKSLQQDIQSKTQNLDRLKQNAQQLTQLMRQIEQENIRQQQAKKHSQQKFSKRKGAMSWPVKGRLDKLFGQTKAAGIKWDGVFIATKEGREVKAIHHGRVAYADWLRGYGLLLIIDHGDGYMSLYGHNQSLFKEVGEWVDVGEAIALTGNSGGQKYSGLYFSVRQNGQPTNPKKWCQKTKGRRL